MNEKGAYSPETYWRHFGSWRAAVEAIGFDADDLEVARDVTNEELLDELERLADAVDGTPTSAQMITKGAYSPETYRKYFRIVECCSRSNRTRATPPVYPRFRR